jgi:phage virion morphogenesis protein
MTTKVEIEVQSQALLDALNHVLTQSDDLSGPMASVGLIMQGATERAFENEEDPATGEAWDDLSDVTKAAREKENEWPGQILQQEGLLAGSVNLDTGKDYAAIGTNRIYATTMHFGAAQGLFGANKRGTPLPWGTIPARPFFGINADDEDDIVAILQDALTPSG